MDVLKKVFRAGTNSQQQPTSSTEPEVPPSSSAAAAIAIQPRALPAGIIITSPSRSPADRIVGSVSARSDGSRENVSASDAVAVNRPISDDVIDPNFKFPPNKPALVRFVPLNPYFPVIEKELIDGQNINIGRYQRHQQVEDPHGEGIYYRSTVVSRRHGRLLFQNGEIFITDIKSLGGTFVNSVRLSSAGKESRPCKVMHGDIIQFGVDYRPDARTGQVRNKDRCVEVRIEFPKYAKKKKMPKPPRWKPAAHTHTECCICLSALYEKQALFIAPCSHTFHYRCIAPLLRTHGFCCPLCRQQSDLHASLFSLDESDDEEVAVDGDADVVQDLSKVRISPRQQRPESPAMPFHDPLRQDIILHEQQAERNIQGARSNSFDEHFMIRAETFASKESVSPDQQQQAPPLTISPRRHSLTDPLVDSPTFQQQQDQHYIFQDFDLIGVSQVSSRSGSRSQREHNPHLALNTLNLQPIRPAAGSAVTPFSAAETFADFDEQTDEQLPRTGFDSATLTRGQSESPHRNIHSYTHDDDDNAVGPSNQAALPLLLPTQHSGQTNNMVPTDLNKCFSEAFYPNSGSASAEMGDLSQ